MSDSQERKFKAYDGPLYCRRCNLDHRIDETCDLAIDRMREVGRQIARRVFDQVRPLFGGGRG